MFTPVQHPTTFAPLQFSQPAPMWNQAGLVAMLNQMHLQDQPPWVMDSGASSHMSSSFPPSFFSFLHYYWQWSHSSYFLSWRVYPSHTSVQFSTL
jgi:hypothetical protein